ncbi:hypothetical protein XELAEV_18002919mg [Xenopus laevis]|uniref:Uncharacterized protein n=1 Tax=Xenopus laevis TaxID=8355 RepID=A0A974BPD5_XENLA|nr:hypothetical protein XELAEV_18002919mg [Xenopus laevis]
MVSFSSTKFFGLYYMATGCKSYTKKYQFKQFTVTPCQLNNMHHFWAQSTCFTTKLVCSFLDLFLYRLVSSS